jgi:hypothetical protein
MDLHLATAVEVTIEANDTYFSCVELCKFPPDRYFMTGSAYPFAFANGTWSLSKYSYTSTSATWISSYNNGSPFTENSDFSLALFPELGTKPGISVRLNASSETGLRQVEVFASIFSVSVDVNDESNSYSSAEMVSLRNSETFPYTNTAGFGWFASTFEVCDEAKPSLLPEVLTTKLPRNGLVQSVLPCPQYSNPCSLYDSQSGGSQTVFKITSVKIFTD